MFRSDLYYRLNGMEITIAPLRARKEDIIPLAYHFLQQAEKGPTGKGVRFRSRVKRALESYDWPGNGRELRYFSSRAVLFRSSHRHLWLSLMICRSISKRFLIVSGSVRGHRFVIYLMEAEKYAIRKPWQRPVKINRGLQVSSGYTEPFSTGK